MSDLNDLLIYIKKAAIEAVKAEKPATVTFGKVISITPLKINVEQKMTLTSEQLILTRNVTDYSTNIEMNINTSENDAHNHKITGTNKITIKNSLVVGDEVILMRMQGGQQYIVLDRQKHDTSNK